VPQCVPLFPSIALAADVESASASLAAAVPFNARFSFSAFVSFSSACTFSGVKKNPGTAAAYDHSRCQQTAHYFLFHTLSPF
jgi:hypothetical protein